MCARALGDASTAVKGHVVRVVGQHGGDAAASIPFAVMSVLHQDARADMKRSS